MKVIKWAGGVAALLVLAFAVLFWQHYAALHPATDDAYLQAHVVDISPQVAGRIEQVLVDSFQSVKQGQPLLRIDASDFKLALQRADAQLTLSRDQVQSAVAQLASARARVDAGRQQLANARDANARLQTLWSKGMAAQNTADKARHTMQQLAAEVKSAQAAVNAASAQLAVARARSQSAGLQRNQAQLNLSRTLISAPADGVIGEVHVQAGNFVDAGALLFPLVKSRELWITANFKETDLQHLAVGQPAQVQLDMYPNRSLQGEVASISPASGESFSLIPAQNATGNWVKVTQRFPVRIRLTQFEADDLLRLGASASVTVDTTAANSGARS